MGIRLGPLPIVTLCNLLSFARAANFTFQYGDTTSCGPFNVSWSGGTPPFQLTLIPLFGTPRQVSVPASSFSSDRGSFSAKIPFPPNQKFLATMSDATGFASGGTSNILTTGGVAAGNSCNTSDPGVDFFFQLNTALNQCRPYTFSAYDRAVQPITITGIIPGGTIFQLTPPVGPTAFDWTANVASGTSIVWMLSDSQGRTGGSSDMKLVGVSDDTSCLSGGSPMSLSLTPSQSSTVPTTTLPDSPTSSPGPGPSKGSNIGLAIGLSIAGVFGIVAVALVLFFLRKRKRSSRRFRHDVDLIEPSAGHPEDHTGAQVVPYPFAMSNRTSSHPESVTFGDAAASSHNLLGGVDYQESEVSSLTNPYSARSGLVAGSRRPHSYDVDGPPAIVGYPPSSSSSSTGRSKAALAGAQAYKPARYIMHTDLEEAQEDEAEVIELPPQYSESRAPIPSLNPNSGSATAQVSSSSRPHETSQPPH